MKNTNNFHFHSRVFASTFASPISMLESAVSAPMLTWRGGGGADGGADDCAPLLEDQGETARGGGTAMEEENTTPPQLSF